MVKTGRLIAVLFAVVAIGMAGAVMRNPGTAESWRSKDISMVVRWETHEPVLISHYGPVPAPRSPIIVPADEEGGGFWSTKLAYVPGQQYFLQVHAHPGGSATLTMSVEGTATTVVCGPKTVPPGGEDECTWTAP